MSEWSRDHTKEVTVELTLRRRCDAVYLSKARTFYTEGTSVQEKVLRWETGLFAEGTPGRPDGLGLWGWTGLFQDG